MENNDLIKQFTDQVIKTEDTSDKSASQIIVSKTRDLVKRWKAEAVFEAVLDGSPIKLNGNDVLINGKVVGHIKYDVADMDGGINFVAADGKFSKEFDDVQALFKYLTTKYNVKENKMEDLGTKIEDPKKVDFEGKENLVKQDGTEGSDVDGKKNADKKSETKGEFKPDDETAVGATKSYGKIKDLIADVKAGKRRTKVTDTGSVVSENKANWNADNSDVDGDGKAARLAGKVKKIKDKADKEGVETTDKNETAKPEKIAKLKV